MDFYTEILLSYLIITIFSQDITHRVDRQDKMKMLRRMPKKSIEYSIASTGSCLYFSDEKVIVEKFTFS